MLVVCPQVNSVAMMLSTLVLVLPCLVAAQNSRIQDLVDSLKNSPRHQSHSPSYTSDRKFDVIGSGELPLQSSSLSSSVDIIDRFDKHPGDDIDDDAETAAANNELFGKDSVPMPFLTPLSVQLTDEVADKEANKGRKLVFIVVYLEII